MISCSHVLISKEGWQTGNLVKKRFSFFQLCDDSLQSGWNPEYTEEIAFLEVIDWCPV